MILIDNQLPLLANLLKSIDTVETFNGHELNPEQIRDSGATALVVRSVTRVTPELISGSSVRFIGSPTSGVDHIAVKELSAMGIRIASAPGCNANAVAEYVMDAVDKYSADSHRSIGIVGFGHIGSLVARYARCRGLAVFVADPPLQELGITFPSWCNVVSLEDLLKESSIITLHVPFIANTPHQTSGLVNSTRLKLISNGAIFINTSRGGIVDEKSLAQLSEQGLLTAVLDVFENEPRIDQSIVDRVAQATPHIAGYSIQAREAGALAIFHAITGSVPDLPLHPLQKEHSSQSPLTALTFEKVRSLWPLRMEKRTPPTWEECDAPHS